MLKIVRPVSFVLLSAAFCSGGVVHASDRAAITPRVGISQQEGSLKGTVSDSFGPVAGASIVVKGTTNGTVTDMNGNFVLDVKKGDVIIRLSNSNLDLQILDAEAQLAEKQNFLRNTQVTMEQDKLNNQLEEF